MADDLRHSVTAASLGRPHIYMMLLYMQFSFCFSLLPFNRISVGFDSEPLSHAERIPDEWDERSLVPINVKYTILLINHRIQSL